MRRTWPLLIPTATPLRGVSLAILTEVVSRDVVDEDVVVVVRVQKFEIVILRILGVRLQMWVTCKLRLWLPADSVDGAFRTGHDGRAENFK